MELPIAKGVSGAGMIAVRATAFFADIGTISDLRLGQVVGIDNTFSGVGNILTGTGHGGFLLD
jgi:hypothetical protein